MSATSREEFERGVDPDNLPPCPPWCRNRELFRVGLGADHGYDSMTMDKTTLSRFHVSGTGDVYLVQEEFNRDGEVTLGPVLLSIPENDGDGGVTAAEARQLAAALLNGADELDAITGAAS